MSETKIVIVDEHDPQNYGNQFWKTEPGELMCYDTGDGLKRSANSIEDVFAFGFRSNIRI